MSSTTNILICGAGPTGLGAAWRLEEKRASSSGLPSWMLVEAAPGPGGMAASEAGDGFTWDIGGHVLFPHYDYFETVVDSLVDEWNEVCPVRGAWMHGGFVPYPVQRNLHRLPPKVCERCLAGLEQISAAKFGDMYRSDTTLAEHLLANFGTGLYEEFLEPLNTKMWAVHPSRMGHSWTSARSGSATTNVPSVDLAQIRRNIEEGRDDTAWDSDTRIRYPRYGGTGIIWERLASKLPPELLHYESRITEIDTGERQATLSDGTRVAYDHLLTSMPLDGLLRALSDRPDLTSLADALQPVAVDVIGIGVQGEVPEQLRGVCSLYIPDPERVFWRVTILSNYSSAMAPGGAWSLLCEINSSASVPRPRGDVVAATIDSLLALGFLANEGDVIARWHRAIDHGYPVPLTGRDELLAHLHTELEAVDILSRGRFGAWKYEISNQDHAFMQGVEAIDRLLDGTPEVTNSRPT